MVPSVEALDGFPPVLLGALSLTAVALAVWWFHARRSFVSHRRGVIIRKASVPLLNELIRRPPKDGTVHLAGIEISWLDETKHFKLIGTTGTGKSTAIRELLRGALSRGDRAVIADPDGGYQREFYDRLRNDVILNPFDKRSAKWDWGGEIDNPYDVEQLASSLIPSSDDAAAQEWRGYARTFLSAVARRCSADRRADPAELWRLITVADHAELRPLLMGSPAQPFLDPENVRMFGSIRSVAASAVAALEHVAQQRAPRFSVRMWVRAAYSAGQIAALRTLIAAWMRIAIFEAMSGREVDPRPLWFVVDELDALGAIDGLKDALARIRKFGGRCVLGFQSIAQVSSTYGAGSAQTIVENCGNTMIFRCSASEHGGTSEFASKLIGEREVVRRQKSWGRDREGPLGTRSGRRSYNVTEQNVTETAILPSELEQLPDLCGYLKVASRAEWRRFKLSRSSGAECPS
jgi:hypothetical protein